MGQIPRTNEPRSVVGQTIQLVPLFRPAQVLPARASVQRAWALVDQTTTCDSVPGLDYGTIPGPYDVTEHGTVHSSILQDETSASISSSSVDVGKSAHSSTSVPAVVQQGTEPLLAHSHSISAEQPYLSCPYNIPGWEETLHRLNLAASYPNLLSSLSNGFRAGIPFISQTYAPANSPSLYIHQEVFDSIIASEFASKRYFGPFSQLQVEQIIGPFQSSPLSLVPKPHSSKFRLVQNLSFPHSSSRLTTSSHISSINSFINSDDFPCTWGTFYTASLLFLHLPPGAQGSTRDVADAFRTIPLHRSQWPGVVIRLSESDTFAINTADSFGLASAGGIWGHLADAICDVFRAEGIGPLTKWVDDFVFLRLPLQHLTEYNNLRSKWATQVQAQGRLHIRSRLLYTGDPFPDGRPTEFDEPMDQPLRPRSYSPSEVFAYSDADIDQISAALGIPWKEEKTTPFCSSVVYLGFEWDLDAKLVRLTMSKTSKYLQAITDWHARPSHTLVQVQELYGKLLHAAYVIPAGRAFLTGLEAMLPTFTTRPDCPHRPAKGVYEELNWWSQRLSKPNLCRSLPSTASFPEIHAFSDASSGVGIGLVIHNAWNAFTLKQGWKDNGREIAWAEAVGLELLLLTTAIVFPGITRIRVYCDNAVVVGGWRSGRSRNKAVNRVFRRIHTLAEEKDWTIIVTYVRSACNPADEPSRGIYLPGPRLPLIDIPAHLSDFLEAVPIGHTSSKSNSLALPKHQPTSSSIALEDELDDFASFTHQLEHHWDRC